MTEKMTKAIAYIQHRIDLAMYALDKAKKERETCSISSWGKWNMRDAIVNEELLDTWVSIRDNLKNIANGYTDGDVVTYLKSYRKTLLDIIINSTNINNTNSFAREIEIARQDAHKQLVGVNLTNSGSLCELIDSELKD